MKIDATTIQCKSRDKNQGPRSSIQPQRQLTWSPLKWVQLNLTNDQKRKYSPHLKACPDAWNHAKTRWVPRQRAAVQRVDCRQGEKNGQRPTLLKRITGLKAVIHRRPTKGESPNSGRLFNTSTFNRVRSEKWPAVALYLNELHRITRLKTVNSAIKSIIHFPT